MLSTTNPFTLPAGTVAQAIQTLVNPTPVVTIYMSKEQESLLPDATLTFLGPEDFDARARQIIETLKQKGILAETVGAQPAFQFSI